MRLGRTVENCGVGVVGGVRFFSFLEMEKGRRTRGGFQMKMETEIEDRLCRGTTRFPATVTTQAAYN